MPAKPKGLFTSNPAPHGTTGAVSRVDAFIADVNRS